MDAQNKFVKIVKEKVAQSNISDLKWKLENDLVFGSYFNLFENATLYQLAFMSLVSENMESIQKKMDSNKDNFLKNDYEGNEQLLVHLIRDIVLPRENSSEWQWKSETTKLLSNKSGPILHFYLDGFNIIDFETYMFEEE